jgi:hypothetical protein
MTDVATETIVPRDRVKEMEEELQRLQRRREGITRYEQLEQLRVEYRALHEKWVRAKAQLRMEGV